MELEQKLIKALTSALNVQDVRNYCLEVYRDNKYSENGYIQQKWQKLPCYEKFRKSLTDDYKYNLKENELRPKNLKFDFWFDFYVELEDGIMSIDIFTQSEIREYLIAIKELV